MGRAPKRLSDDLGRVDNLALHQLVEHVPDHLSIPLPECRDGAERVDKMGVGETAEEAKISLEGVDEVGEGGEADRQQRLDG